MNTTLELRVTGIGAWLPGAADWPTLQGILRGERGTAAAVPLPSPDILPPAERRRAPASVRLAVATAQQACAMAVCDPAAMPCVFASSLGDPAITDYVCATLARAPLELSPTRFHNSVLNAPAGYWTIATGCTAASSAVTAHGLSFSAGLLEACVIACADATPVLFACGNVASTGPLAEMTRTSLACGTALVLAPASAAGAKLRLTPRTATAHSLPPAVAALRHVADDSPANAHALALLSILAARQPAALCLPLSAGLCLDMEVTP
ncbi:MAG TPA: beta-ketoacyl synthase chain length factor [Rhodanobacteraceae bacterium]